MGRLARTSITLGLAGLLPATAAVLGQAERPAARVAPAAILKQEVVEEKKAEPPAIDVQGLADQLLKALGPARPQAAPGDKPPNPMVQQQIKQSLLQLRPTLRGELHFLRATCSPTPEQHRALARDGELAMAEAAREYAEAFVQLQKGGVRNGQMPNPQATLARRMLALARQHLSAEQLARYREAADRRTAARREGTARALVALLDESLRLRPDQREKIVADLASHWDEEWSDSFQMLLSNPQYFLNVPDNLVSPHLDPAQRTLWNAKPKVNFGGNFGNFGVLGGLMLGDDWGLGAAPPEAKPADPAPRPAGGEEARP